MRVLMTVEFPVEPGNAAMRDGTLPKTIQSILDEQKPEAAYFVASNGKRSALLFLDMQEPSQIPALAEPWFLAFNAGVEIRPVMNAEDLVKAKPAIEQVVKKYSRPRR
jgi:hypothetical protein